MGYLCDFICAHEDVVIAFGALFAVTAFAIALALLTPSMTKVVQALGEADYVDDQVEELQETEANELEDNRVEEPENLGRIIDKQSKEQQTAEKAEQEQLIGEKFESDQSSFPESEDEKSEICEVVADYLNVDTSDLFEPHLIETSEVSSYNEEQLAELEEIASKLEAEEERLLSKGAELAQFGENVQKECEEVEKRLMQTEADEKIELEERMVEEKLENDQLLIAAEDEKNDAFQNDIDADKSDFFDIGGFRKSEVSAEGKEIAKVEEASARRAPAAPQAWIAYEELGRLSSYTQRRVRRGFWGMLEAVSVTRREML